MVLLHFHIILELSKYIIQAISLTHWCNLQISDIIKIEQLLNTYHCGWVYVPSGCWTEWSVHGRCHIRMVFHRCVYEGDVSAWTCLGLHTYSVDTEEKTKRWLFNWFCDFLRNMVVLYYTRKACDNLQTEVRNYEEQSITLHYQRVAYVWQASISVMSRLWGGQQENSGLTPSRWRDFSLSLHENWPWGPCSPQTNGYQGSLLQR
jgi:hypothetical protein